MPVSNERIASGLIATAQIADACVRLNIPIRVAPHGIKTITKLDTMVVGSAVPVRHYGSIDILLEALEVAPAGGIIVIDNGGRFDEACIGDLTVLEVKNAGMSAIILWGLHRDTTELQQIGFPVFSYGTYPAGPRRLDVREADALRSAHFGDFLVTERDTVFADDDGVLFVETSQLNSVLDVAATIRTTEIKQAAASQEGKTLREQFHFHEFLKKRQTSKTYTFRDHLRMLSKSIEE